MAFVTVDSELMSNYVSAAPVAAGSHNVAVLDERRGPMLFTLGSRPDPSAPSDLQKRRPRLCVLRRTPDGQSEFFDLQDKLGLGDNNRIQAFHVEQSWSLKLYLVLAVETSENTADIKVFRPFSPEALHADSQALSAVSGSRTYGTARAIYMSPISGVSTDNKYPDVFLVHKQLNQIASWGSDISHVKVNASLTRWNATDEFNTPQNVSQVLDVAPAVSPYGQGLYVLYVSQGQTRLYARFLRPDPYATDGTMFTFTTDVMCPPSARCLTSFLNDKGFTGLLIASAEGIHCLNVADSTSKDRPGKLVFRDSMVKDIREISVAQDHQALTIWLRNRAGEVGYVRTTTALTPETAVQAMLLPAGSSTAFAPVVTSPAETTGRSTRQMVVSNDSHGNFVLIEQTDDIGLWRKTPFYAPAPSSPSELQSYTVTIKARDQDGRPLSNGSVYISASSSLSILLNGSNMLLTKVPTWYDCDSSGSINLIIPTESLGSQALRIDGLRLEDGTVLKSFQKVDYDPAHKPMALLTEKLHEAQDSHEAFKSLKTATGQALFDSSVANDAETLKAAQKQLTAVTKAYSQSVSPDPTVSNMLFAMASARDSTGDFLMDAWHWVKEKAHEVTEWFVDTAGAVWKFVCKIAGELKEFVLDCVEKICEAASWIWDKVKVGWHKLVEFIGFLFDWDDIIQTKNTISSTVNAGFDYAGLKIDFAAGKIDSFFDGLEKTIDQFGDGIKANKKVGDKSAQSGADSKSKQAQNSTSATWAQERLKNGGAGTGTEASLNGATTNDEATNFWQAHIVPTFEKLGDQLSKVGKDVLDLFQKDGSIEMDDVLKLGKDVLKAALTAIRGIVQGLLGLVKGLVTLIKRIGNAEIEIPIFSWLYKKISGGHALTLLDAISLIIAIPTTIFAKLITGQAPPKFSAMDGPTMKALLEGEDAVSQQTKTDWAVFKAEVAVGVTLTTGVIGVIKLLYKAGTGGADALLKKLDAGPGSLLDIFGIVADMIGCLVAIPDEVGLPGAECRYAMSAISFFRGLYHVVVYFTGVDDNVAYGIDLVTVLANLGLSIAVGIEEKKAASTWADYDEPSNDVGFLASGLNAVAGIAYFTAFVFKTDQPEVSAVAACVMVGTMAGTAVLDGAQFKLQYDKDKHPRLTSSASY